MAIKTSKSWDTENINGAEYGQIGGTGVMGFLNAESTLLTGRFNERQTLFNADMADRAAQDAITKGEEQVNDIRRKTKQLVGEQRAAFAAQGIDINSGSAADVQEDSHFWGVQDELTARNNAFLESYGYKMKALNLRTQAEVTRVSSDYKYRLGLIQTGMDMGEKAAKAGAGGA